MPLNPEDFGASFKNFMNVMATTTEKGFFQDKLQNHFQVDSTQLAIVTETFQSHEQPNLHLAMEEYLKESNRSHELFGVVTNEHFGVGLAELLKGASTRGLPPPTEGPVAYSNVQIGDDKTMQCIKSGLYLISEDQMRLAVFLHSGMGLATFRQGEMKLDVMAPNRIVAEAFVKEIKKLMRQHNVYRGQLLAVEGNMLGEVNITFKSIRNVGREAIILPQGLLEEVEKSTIHFGRHAEKLLSWKRHLRRGLLLYGAPGTGKTLTAMYLASAMQGRTVMLMTGRGLGTMGKTCQLARALQPSLVIIEDVDLIAENRKSETARMGGTLIAGIGGTLPLLMELLNEMDGLTDDTDTIFLLTTNRPEVLEPALAARPGRIDQAFELPLPDAECRKRLFELYGEGLPMKSVKFDEAVSRTEGASPAFIKELMRMAASFAADEDAEYVTTKHIQSALHDLVLRSTALTKSILGFQQASGIQGLPISEE